MVGLESDEVYVVEGMFGCMNLYQHGYTCVVSTMGSHLSDIQAEMLEHFHSATFLIDPDKSGAGLPKQTIDKLHGRIMLKLIFPSSSADENGPFRTGRALRRT